MISISVYPDFFNVSRDESGADPHADNNVANNNILFFIVLSLIESTWLLALISPTEMLALYPFRECPTSG